jgi:hypothetical protein
MRQGLTLGSIVIIMGAMIGLGLELAIQSLIANAREGAQTAVVIAWARRMAPTGDRQAIFNIARSALQHPSVDADDIALLLTSFLLVHGQKARLIVTEWGGYSVHVEASTDGREWIAMNPFLSGPMGSRDEAAKVVSVTYVDAVPVPRSMQKPTRSGADLVRMGYHQISRKDRMVARLPEGKTGLEALTEVDPGMARTYFDNMTRVTTDHYLRVYGKDTLELTEAEFEDFRNAGGRSVL